MLDTGMIHTGRSLSENEISAVISKAAQILDIRREGIVYSHESRRLM